MSTVSVENIRRVLTYLADRNRGQEGSWISVADVRGALALDWSEAEEACRTLGEQSLAELMGGFPLKPTRDRFTLVRLTATGQELAADPRRLESYGDSAP